MDRYRSNEGTQSDPNPEWKASAAQTGLEESMWQLGLGSGSGEPYPERPGEPDCIYFLRTGSCGYGDHCRFNHPRHRPQMTVGVGRVSGGELPERAGQPVCQYYMKTGTCKFGSSCKYHHPRQGAGSISPFALNTYGYPLRPGEKECSYFMKTGQCKFGMTCKFHHPQPANVQLPTPTPVTPIPPAPVPSPTAYPPPLPIENAHAVPTPTPAPQQYGMVPGIWPFVRPPMVPSSYIQGPYGPMLLSPGVVPLPSWAPYPVPNPVSTPTTQSPAGAGQVYGITSLSPSAAAYSGSYPVMSSSVGHSSSISREHSFPQRPGQPECQYYLKTGDCKFGTSCKYHHPAEWVVPETSYVLSPMGLPLRRGTPTCSYYAHHGVCKFGPTCKYDHPLGALSYSPSASSLSDMPVAPYPVGSSRGTLAPSSSSSDLRTEVISGSNKDSSSVLPSSTRSISGGSGSGGSILSKSGSILQSGVQQSNPSTTSSDSAGPGPGAPS